MHPFSEERDGSVEICRFLAAVQTLVRRDSRSDFELAVVARDSLGRHLALRVEVRRNREGLSTRKSDENFSYHAN